MTADRNRSAIYREKVISLSHLSHAFSDDRTRKSAKPVVPERLIVSLGCLAECSLQPGRVRQGVNSRGRGSGRYTCVGNMKITYERSEREAASALAGDQGVSEVLAFNTITRDEPIIPVSPPPARNEVLELLVQHIAALPTATKKILSLHYYEDFSVSEIAACSNLSKQQICEILSHTRGLLRKLFTRYCSPGAS